MSNNIILDDINVTHSGASALVLILQIRKRIKTLFKKNFKSI